jgi:hypothetical protein
MYRDIIIMYARTSFRLYKLKKNIWYKLKTIGGNVAEMKDMMMKSRTALQTYTICRTGNSECLCCGNLRFRTGKRGFLIRNGHES